MIDRPQSFVKTQKITFYMVVMGAINFNFSILTDVVVNIFWRISAHVDLANQVIGSKIKFSVVLDS